MKTHATGNIKVYHDLTLENPSMEIENVTYSWKGDNMVRFEIIFKENDTGLRHSRMYETINNGGVALTGDDMLDLLKTIPELDPFTGANNSSWTTWFKNFFNNLF